MDTLNSRLEANSAMSNSETHSDKTASDDDDQDFKSNIPYCDEANSRANTSTSTSRLQPSGSYEMLNRSLEGDDDDPGNFNYSQWDNDDMDNMSNMDTDFEAYSGNDEAASCYATTSMRAASSFAYAQDGPSHSAAARKHKHAPKELLLPPPSSSSLHYNYSYPSQSTRPVHPAPYPAFVPPHMSGSHLQYGAAASDSGAAAYSQHVPGFHPNMWHPNAPYGTGGAYGYYGPYRSQPYAPYSARYQHQDPMLDMLQLSNSGREARNRAEKNRRDKLNGSIQELSTMVPHVAESPRRVDKTAVLRFAAHGLRLQYVFGESLNQTRPQVTDSLMKLLDSFFITLTCHGQIVLISSSIEQHLGHCQADLYGQNILHITHPEDHSMLKQLLIPTDLENLFDIQPDDNSGEPRSRTAAEEEYIDRLLREDKRNFTVRLARAGPRSEPIAYEVVKFDGCFRRSDAAPRGVKTSTFPSTLQLIRRTRGRDDAIPLHTISGNDIVLVALARIIRPPRVSNSIVENSLEYKTRHLIDGRIIDCDQRIGLVAGYMTDEVRNLSPFTFMHQDDVRWVIVALRQMYDCNSSYGESTYRLLTRNGNFIYLQTNGYLEINKDTNKVHSFVCVNTLLDEEEGRRRVQEMKKKFSTIINTSIPPQSSIDAPASDNPQQLEKAVLCLIQNLQKTSSDDEDENDATSSGYTSGSADALRERNAANALRQKLMSAGASATPTPRASKTPPLALVPPETASVKTSISKSVSIVNVTAAKSFRGNQRVRSPMSTTSDEGVSEVRYHFDLNTSQTEEECTCQLREGDCSYCQNAAAINQQLASPATPASVSDTGLISATKRSISCCSDGGELRESKRRLKSTDIEQVLSSSLDQIGRTLDQQLNAAKELRDQGNLYEVPNSIERIDEIMEEHQKQSELYVNIKSEYEVQLQSKAIDSNTTSACTSTSTSTSASASEPHANMDLKPR